MPQHCDLDALTGKELVFRAMRAKRHLFFLKSFFVALMGLAIMTTTAQASFCTLQEDGDSIVWSVGNVRIWRFPMSCATEIYDAVARLEKLYEKRFNIKDVRVLKRDDTWTLCVGNQELLTAKQEYVGPIRVSAKAMSLFWVSRIYEAFGDLHAEALTSAYHLRGKHKLTGTVSWYGGKNWFGRRFANGERFEETVLTAAAKNLPFGTLVRLRDSVTGRTVVVRITDRFFEHKGRVLDISLAAAEILGIKGRGVAKVDVEVLGKVGVIGGS